MGSVVQVQTAVATRDEARALAEVLVDRRLAACVQIVGPVESRYRWHGRVEVAEEWLCLSKTAAGVVPSLLAAIAELHPYEVPEVVALETAATGTSYERWVHEETST